MKSVLISEFKARCIELLKKVRAGEPLQVTLRGEPLVVIYPAISPGSSKRELGVLREFTKINSNLLQEDTDEWEMNKT